MFAGPAAGLQSGTDFWKEPARGVRGIEEPQPESTAGLEPKGGILLKTREESVEARKMGEGCFS